MAGTDPGTAGAGNQFSTPVPRRRVVEALLGSGFLATAVAFFYPVLRYLVPPQESDLGGDSVVAGRVGELKPNSGKIFRFGQHPGLLIRTASGEYRAMSARPTSNSTSATTWCRFMRFLPSSPTSLGCC